MVAPFQTPFITALALSPAVLATLASVLPAKQDADGWQAMQAAPPDHRMTFNIVLKGRNPDQLHDKMLYIARTRSNWLTSAELGQYVSPLEEAQGAVQALLSKHGVVKEHVVVNRLQNVWTVEADVGTVSSMFNADFHMYRHSDFQQLVPRAAHLSIPTEVKEHVDRVEGLVSLPRVKPLKYSPLRITPNPSAVASKPTGPSAVHQIPPGCLDDDVSLACIRRYYGLDLYHPKPLSASVAAVTLNLDAWRDQTIKDFEAHLRPEASGYIPNKRYLGADSGGWNNVTKDHFEALLDIETLIALSWPLNLTTFMWNDARQDDEYALLMRELIDLPDNDRPEVVSISFGLREIDYTYEEAARFCAVAQQLVALGTSVLVAPGDFGVEMTHLDNTVCPPFDADFMSGCSYVISVGGTARMSEERAGYLPDQPDEANGWSSGGFSNRSLPLDFQVKHLKKYLETTGLASSTDFNTSGRGFVDVSAIGQNVSIWFSEGLDFIGGTSVSTPIFAATLGLLNSKCKEVGRPIVGWAHPTLYDHPEALNDITIGGAYGCEETKLGFPCTVGWDPATGLGSPHFPKLVKAFGCGTV